MSHEVNLYRWPWLLVHAEPLGEEYEWRMWSAKETENSPSMCGAS